MEQIRLASNLRFIAGGRVVDEGPVLPKAGTVTGTVPAVFGGIVLQRTAHMGAPGDSGGQDSQGGLQAVHRQLGTKHGPGGGEQL